MKANFAPRSAFFNLRVLIGLFIVLAGVFPSAHAQITATWKLNPVDNNWNNPANWSTNQVPGPLDTARFRTSNITSIFTSADVEVAGIVFTPGASAYTVTNSHTTTVSGIGVTNNSGMTQNFLCDEPDSFTFTNSAGAGNLTVYTNEGAAENGQLGGKTEFFDSSTAGAATLIANGGTITGAGGGRIVFHDSSTAANSTLLNMTDAEIDLNGPAIQFLDSSLGGTASVVLNGGMLDISSHDPPGVTIGSLEGPTRNSLASLLGANRLTVGTNDTTTSFGGVISGTGGSLTKKGTGTLTLGGANTYTGGTTVSAGTLLLQRNGNSSQTGTDNVIVNTGTLGGDGIAAGNVIIGNGSGGPATLAPGYVDTTLFEFTTKKKLTLKSDSDFVCQFDSEQVAAEKVQARGVSIGPGATFSFREVGTGTMQIGTVFILINNTAQTPINGTFAGIPEGAKIFFGNYLWRFSYVGGNGNDFSGEIIERFVP